MTAIDPDVRAVLEQVEASVPAPGGFDVAFFRATAEGSPGGPSPVAPAAVEDAVIPGGRRRAGALLPAGAGRRSPGHRVRPRWRLYPARPRQP